MTRRDLTLVHDTPVSSALWTFDPQRCTITINVLHPRWAECERDERLLLGLQKEIIAQVMGRYRRR